MESSSPRELSEPESRRSDHSQLSSTSCMADPFLVTLHVITNPGDAAALQGAVDNLVTWINPELRLFIASERGSSQPRGVRRGSGGSGAHPALAVIIFVHEECGQQISQLHERFLHPPWEYHHTEMVKGRILPYMPRNQDFFTLANHNALWAVRQVHYGKEIVRFTIYCSFENFVDMARMYQLILRRESSQRKPDFVFFTVYSNTEVDVQLSLKRLPKGQGPSPTELALLEFRVHDIGHLIPLLPNPCSPISDLRWQTEDYDGNKLLLQVHSVSRSSWKRSVVAQSTAARNSSCRPPRSVLPQCLGCSPDRHPRRRWQANHKPQHTSGFSRFRGTSQEDIWIACRGDSGNLTSRVSRVAQRSKSLFCLPTFSSSSCSSSSSSPLGELALSLADRGQQVEDPALDITSGMVTDGLEGAAETNVDTGLTTSCSDLSTLTMYSTLNGFGKELGAALPQLGDRSTRKKAGLFRSSLSTDTSPPSSSGLSSRSSPGFQEFSSCPLTSRTAPPRAFTATSWIWPRTDRSSCSENATRNKSCREGRQPTAILEGEQEFYI